MTKKELEQYNDLQREIRKYNEKKTLIMAKATHDTQAYSSVPGGKNLSDRTGIGGSELADIEKALEEAYCKRVTELFKLVNYIEGIQDSFIRGLFISRFINGYSWVKVAIEAGGSNSADGVRMSVERYLENH